MRVFSRLRVLAVLAVLCAFAAVAVAGASDGEGDTVLALGLLGVVLAIISLME